MNVEELKVGRAYFACSYLLRHKPVPEIETWIYIGKNISASDKDSDDTYHYFQDPETYFLNDILAELTEDQAQEYERPEEPVRLRVLEADVEDLVHDLSELESFVRGLSSEPNADKAF